jgi:hypothetical protein
MWWAYAIAFPFWCYAATYIWASLWKPAFFDRAMSLDNYEYSWRLNNNLAYPSESKIYKIKKISMIIITIASSSVAGYFIAYPLVRLIPFTLFVGGRW